MKPELIFCAGNNPTFANIAVSHGYHYGCRLPCDKPFEKVYFADQNWKNPNRSAYMAALNEYRPHIASVIDWEYPEQLPDVISWAKSAALFVDIVVIIPKVSGGIAQLPRRIDGKEIRLGYSVPTKHGGTMLHIAEFIGWPVHLLGGSPGAQMRLARYMDVRSADGNMHLKMANRGLYWVQGKRTFSNDWVSILEMDGERFGGNGNHESFRRSCINIMAEWDRLYNNALHSDAGKASGAGEG